MSRLAALWAKFKAGTGSFWTKVTSDLGDLWEKDKAFVIAFGLIILAVKFREILINLLVASGKAIFTKAESTNAALDKQEQSDNANAEKLIEDAKQLSNSQPPVDDNWYQK